MRGVVFRVGPVVVALLTGCTGGTLDGLSFACRTSVDCLEGWSCVSGTCQRDGAGDGGRTDSGFGDDAGYVDGGSPDGGAPDGGGREDGGTDGGVDAGGGDAGTTDGGNVDAGDMDAGTAALTVDLQRVDFGDVTVMRTSGPRTLTISNVGGLPTGALAVALSGAQAPRFRITTTTCTSALGPGSACQVTLVFEPTVDSVAMAALEVSGVPGGLVSTALQGRGRAEAALSVTPSARDFGAVVLGSTSLRTFTVTNVGGSVTGLLSATVGGADGSMFIVTDNTCTAPLAPAGDCLITVTFGPSSAGSRSANLEVSATPGGARVVSMTGLAQTPAALSGAPSPGVFGATTVGSTTGQRVSFSFTNQGQAATPSLTTSLGGANAADFTVLNDACNAKTVPGGGACTVELQFQPTARGPRTGTLTVSGPGLVPAVIPLAGTGQTPATVSLSAAMVNFGSVVTGSAGTATVGVSNTGDVATGAPTFGSSGPPFTVESNTCGVSIAPGTNCAVTLRFSPTVTGTSSGVLTATASPGGTATATLSGAGVSGSTLTITPATYAFGNVLLGATATHDFTVQNVSATSLVVSVAVGGANATSFVKSNDTCGTLTASATCSFRITFTPGVAGALAGFVQASATGQVAQASLSGTGQRPAALSVSPDTFTWPSTLVGATGASATFTVTNTGDIASGVLASSLGGVAASQFGITADSCTGTSLTPQGTCVISVNFAPTSSGLKQATVTLTGAPGGSTSAVLEGTAQTTSTLTLTPVTSASFGSVVIGSSATRTFTLSNTGQQATGPLSLAVTGPNAAMFQVATGVGLCQAGQALAGGASCTVSVTFAAGSSFGNGAKQASLTASASPGGAPSLNLTATALNPANLVGSVKSWDFGGAEVNQSSAPFIWTVQNTGDVATSTLSLVNRAPTEFVVSTTTCSGALGPGASCQVTLTFRPSAGGVRDTDVTVTAVTGGSATVMLSGKGQWRLSLAMLAPAGATGLTTSTSDGRLSCAQSGCSALYDDGASVTVRATTTNGSDVFFSSWELPSPTACQAYGTGNACTVTLKSAVTVNALFLTITGNLAFVSSVASPATLGGTTQFDAVCNTLATGAGINNLAGDAYVAWISTDTSPVIAPNRLGVGKGSFIRMDGTFFALSEAELLAGFVLAPLNLDEYGRLTTGRTWTGTDTNGTPITAEDCVDWTSTSGTAAQGELSGGPGSWTLESTGNACTGGARVSCLMRTSRLAQLPPSVPAAAKGIYLTDVTTTPGSGLAALDAFCNANKPLGFASRTFVALVATGAASAGSRLSPTASYYRPDGLLVGVSASIRLGALRTGLWMTDVGTYVNEEVWTGAPMVDALATPTSNCLNWTSSSPLLSATVGRSASVNASVFFGATTGTCAVARRVYCAEP